MNGRKTGTAKNILETVCSILSENDYDDFSTVLNSADCGVPQVHERVFVTVVRKNEAVKNSLPVPTHHSEDKMLTAHQKMFEGYSHSDHFMMPKATTVDPPVWRAVKYTLSDLPKLFPGYCNKYKLNPGGK